MSGNSLLKFQSATSVWLGKKLKEEHNKDSKLQSLVIFSIHFNELFASVRRKIPKYCRRDRMNENKVVLCFFKQNQEPFYPCLKIC